MYVVRVFRWCSGESGPIQSHATIVTSSPWRGRDLLRKVPMDEKVVSTLHAPPQGESQASPEFQVSLMPQPGFFPPITPQVFQAYTKLWQAQVQAQSQAKQGQYLVPPTTTFAQLLAQPMVKLSKLVKEAR